MLHSWWSYVEVNMPSCYWLDSIQHCSIMRGFYVAFKAHKKYYWISSLILISWHLLYEWNILKHSMIYLKHMWGVIWPWLKKGRGLCLGSVLNIVVQCFSVSMFLYCLHIVINVCTWSISSAHVYPIMSFSFYILFYWFYDYAC